MKLKQWMEVAHNTVPFYDCKLVLVPLHRKIFSAQFGTKTEIGFIESC